MKKRSVLEIAVDWFKIPLPSLVFTGLQFLIIIPVGIAYGLVYILSDRQKEPDVMSIAVAATVGMHLLAIPVMSLWYMKTLPKTMRRPRLKRENVWQTILPFLIAVFFGLLMNIFSNGVVFLEELLIPEVVEQVYEEGGLELFGTNPFMMFTAVCLAPIGEEFLCRGLTCRYALKATNFRFWAANLIQAAVFGIIHMNIVQGVYAFFGGLVLGYMVWRFKSILPAIAMHLTVNFSSVLGLDAALMEIPVNGFTICAMLLIPTGLVILTMLLLGSGQRIRQRN